MSDAGTPCCHECAAAQRKGEMMPGESCDPCIGGSCDVRPKGKGKKPNCPMCITKCSRMAWDQDAVHGAIRSALELDIVDPEKITLYVLKSLWPRVDGLVIAWNKVDESWDPCLYAIGRLVYLCVVASAAIYQLENEIAVCRGEGLI